MNERLQEIGEWLEQGMSIIPVRNGMKASLIPYRQYETTLPTLAKWEGWRERWPDCGTAVVLGAHHVALDVDRADVTGLPTEWMDTMTILTPRPGRKAIYKTTGVSWHKVVLGDGVELWGQSMYAILPRSRSETGTYLWERRVEPAALPDDLAALAATSHAATASHVVEVDTDGELGALIRCAGRLKKDCIRQILIRHLPANTERNDVLWTLAVLIRAQGWNQEKASRWLEVYYRHGCEQKGMDSKEVSGIVRSVYRKGYKLSHEEIRRRLPWMDCGRCPYLRKVVKPTMDDEVGFLWKVSQAFKGDSDTKAVALELAMSGDWEVRKLNDSQLAERTGLDRRTVRTRLAKLEDAGLLPGEHPSLKLL